MAFDWSKLTYSQLLALAQQQDPSMLSAAIPSMTGGDNGDGSNVSRNDKLDLSSLGIPMGSITQSPYGGFAFNGKDPGGSGHFVSIHKGPGDSVTPFFFNPSTNSLDHFLDWGVPAALTLGAGYIAGGAAAAGGMADSGGGAITPVLSTGGTSIPADISGELASAGSGLQGVTSADIAAAGGGNSALGSLGTTTLGGGGGGSLLASAGGGAPEMGSFAPGTAPIGTATNSMGDISSSLGGLPSSTGVTASDIASAGGGTLSGGGGLSDILSGANSLLGSPLGKLAGTLLGGYIGSKPNQQTSDLTRQIDPRLVPYVYGQGGVLQNAGNLYNANPSGINDNMRAGWQTQLNALTNPATTAAYQNMIGMGSRLMSTPTAGNPFTTGLASLSNMPTQFRNTLGG